MADWVDVAQSGVTAVAAIAAGSLGYFGQRLISKATLDREEAGRAAERELRAADYQRGTLQALQEAVVELLEAAYTVAWPGGTKATTEELKRRHSASAQVTLLTQRVASADVRTAVDLFAAVIEHVRHDASPDAAVAGLEAQDKVQEAIGQVLRSLP